MKLKTIIFVILSAASIFAQTEIGFDFDYARFKYNDKIYCEIYYSINQSNLTVFKKDDTESVSAYITIKFTNTDSNKVVVRKKYQVNSSAADGNSAGKNLLGVLGFLINEGNYIIDIKASDFVDTNKSKSYSERINVKSFDNGKTAVSDIQFASRIINESVNKNSVFYKNTMEVFPHPVNVYGQNYPILFYYSELYNLQSDTSKGDLILNSQIIDSKGKKVFEKSKSVSRKNNEVVEVGAVNISKFISGSYTFLLNIYNQKSQKGLVSSKKFYVYNPSVVDSMLKEKKNNMGVESSEFAVLSEEECDEMFVSAQYIATGNEIDKFRKLSGAESKREFLFQFWKIRDSDTSTPENEFKNEYNRRINHVEMKYRSFNKRGVKTDRGRVYLIYGEPDEIELHPNDYDKKPYEIWYYNSIEGGVYFVFGDLAGYSDYELIHSTKRGEMRDDNWARRILTN
jgi:GWxTD domain-containing protein